MQITLLITRCSTLLARCRLTLSLLYANLSSLVMHTESRMHAHEAMPTSPPNVKAT